AKLLTLGGSPYYLVAGILLLATAVMLFRGDARAKWLFSAFLVGTVLWAIAEAGFDGWALAPRVAIPLALALPLLPRGPHSPGAGLKSLLLPVMVAGGALVLVVGVAISSRETFLALDPPAAHDTPAAHRFTAQDGEWHEYGRDKAG